MKYLKADEIVDLELFIEEDKTESEDYKNNRDFELYSQASEFNKQDDTSLLSFWIEKMRGISGKMSVGKFSQMLYGIVALVLVVFGVGLGYKVVSLLLSKDVISVNSAFIVIALSAFFLFSWVLLGLASKFVNFLVKVLLRLIFASRGNLGLVEKKNRNYFAAKGKFFAQFFGLAFVLSVFFTSYFAFADKDYKFQYSQEHNLGVDEIHLAFEIVALPWSFTMGEGLLYPSKEDIDLANPSLEDVGESQQGVWKNFWLAGIFVYGVLPRLIVFFVCLFKGRNHFGKHKVLNDSDISIILNRMKLSSSNKTNWQSLKNDKDCQNLLILRSDLVNYSDVIKTRASKQTKFEKFNLHKYEFLSDFFTDDFAAMQAPYKNFTIAFLADDYNDEVFENMQNLINVYPEKLLNVLLLGRYNAAENSFEELVSVEKSWWERKLNAISTQNINIY